MYDFTEFDQYFEYSAIMSRKNTGFNYKCWCCEIHWQ